MPTSGTKLPSIRKDLIVRKVADDEFVVKTCSRQEYFCIGNEEHFLLTQLQVTQTVDELCNVFEREFGDSLSDEEIDEFLQLVRSRGLTDEPEDSPAKQTATAAAAVADDDEDAPGKQQSILFYRLPLFDPDRLFAAIEPRVRWIWTRGFFTFSILMILAAAVVLWTNRLELVSGFSQAMRWEMLIIVGLAIFAATALHEFAHGMTCKHFGGEVHEVGLLLMFFMPCLFCNVSDAWLIPEKSKRLWITAAGAMCDLCLWAVCVFIWRITIQDSLVNHLSLVMLTVCGSRGFINLNPLLRFDGYYLVSDWLAIPNLRRRSMDYWMQHLRYLLWGADRPTPQARGRALFIYGLFSWCFALVLLDIIFLRLLKFAVDEFGVVGIVFTGLLLVYAVRRVFKGFFASEFMKMIKFRHKRTIIWAVGVLGAIGVLFVIPVPFYATGTFEVRPGVLFEVRALVGGFVRAINIEEGAHVNAGDVLVRLESPDLASQIETKRAELRESDAKLAKFRLGPRPEEVTMQRNRVERLTTWCELGNKDLQRAKQELENEIVVLDNRVQQTKTELTFAKSEYSHSQRLYNLGALAGTQLKFEQKGLIVLESRLNSVEAERRARVANGARAAEAEVARRQQELADAKSQLLLLEVGTRPEDITGEEAHRERVQKELLFLESQQVRLEIHASVSGVIATPRMQEKMGQLAIQGSPICVIEDASTSQVEISVDESSVEGIEPGQSIRLKARALPFRTFNAIVDRIAPAATQKENVQENVLIVYCTLDNESEELKSGMTGFARIDRGRKSLGVVIITKVFRYLRTEFWW